jgi:hypothetical protein
MGRHAKTIAILNAAVEVLKTEHPMTVRQVYYRLVSRQDIENSRSRYQAVSDVLVEARKNGDVEWDWIEDRLRQPCSPSMYTDLRDFLGVVNYSYRKDVWPTQPLLLEAWCEKDALSGIFEDTLRPYGVTLNTGRGYDGWDSLYRAQLRYRQARIQDKPVVILYFGDHDPSGEDMVRSLRERLEWFRVKVEIVKCAILHEDIDRYNLPPNFAKQTDTRRKAFVEKYGDKCVELDALPVDVLKNRIIEAVESRMDMKALAEIEAVEVEERKRLTALIDPRQRRQEAGQ